MPTRTAVPAKADKPTEKNSALNQKRACCLNKSNAEFASIRHRDIDGYINFGYSIASFVQYIGAITDYRGESTLSTNCSRPGGTVYIVGPTTSCCYG